MLKLKPRPKKIFARAGDIGSNDPILFLIGWRYMVDCFRATPVSGLYEFTAFSGNPRLAFKICRRISHGNLNTTSSPLLILSLPLYPYNYLIFSPG